MKKNWLLTPPLSGELTAANSDISPVLLQLLVNRGLTELVAIKNFLSSDNESQWHSPFAFRQMRAVAELIIEQIKSNGQIAICGDYDADGITASAVLFETLTTLKAKVSVWIPNRLTDGYGLNKRLIDQIKAAGCKLIITVDNGIRSRAETAYAREQGLTMIITDHHAPPEQRADWPDGLIINPIIEEETYPFKYLAGVGVAFKLAEALIESAILAGELKRRLKERVLDLVAVGTIADCVSLLGENRFLVRAGLRQLNQQRRLGLNELIKVAELKGEVNEWNVSWQLAPRLNVAGRLEHANTAYQLLITANPEEAATLARHLNEQNIKRQEETKRLVDYCQDYIDKNLSTDKLLVLVAPAVYQTGAEAWHEGVIGLVAGRLCERYHRPTLLLTTSEGKIKGSGRSIEGYDIMGLLEQTKEHLERYGGHKAACGFSIKNKEQLAAFIEQAKALTAASLATMDLTPRLMIDAELTLNDIDSKLVEDMGRLAPFGQGNREPTFVSYRLLLRDKQVMGLDNQHVKFRFGNFWAVAFGEAVKWQEFVAGQTVDVVYGLEFNDYNGQRAVQWRLIDMRPSLS